MDIGMRASVLLGILFLIFFNAEARKDGSKKLRCKYDKSKSPWSKCHTDLHVQTKEAKLIGGRKRCPSYRIYTRPCGKGVIIINGCKYVQVTDWSKCDNTIKTTTRTLELAHGDHKSCDNNTVESKTCSEDKKERDKSRRKSGGSKKKKRKRKKGKRKGRQRKGKNRKKQKYNHRKISQPEHNPDCIYKRKIWGNCDLTTGLQTAVQELKSVKNSSVCEKTRVTTLPCGIKKTKQGSKKSSKVKLSEHERKKKRKEKKRKEKKKKKVKDEISQEPPHMTELYVVPYSTFVVVSWLPPQRGEGGPPVPVDGYQIGYGRGFPDVHTVQINASEVTYKITGLEPGWQYIISIRAYNQMGVGQALYETVMTRAADGADVPVIMPPIGTQALVLSAHDINVTWVDMAVNEDPSQKREYYLRYRPLHKKQSASHSAPSPVSPVYASPRFKVQKSSSQRQYSTVEGLNPYTMYEFSVLASDGQRNSTWSMMVWNVTHEAAPSSAPRDLTVIIDPDTPGQVILTWMPPLEANGVITSYDVTYMTENHNGKPIEERLIVEGSKLSVTLSTLFPGVTYDFSVKATNRMGVGPPLRISNYQLPGDPVPVPATLTASPAPNDPRAVMLVWEIPQKVNADILGFVILYTQDLGKDKNKHWEVESRLGHALRMAVVEGLDPDTSYHFKVQAHTSIGYGPESNTVLYNTPTADEKIDLRPVDPPRNVRANILSSTSVVVSWQDPGLARIYEEGEVSLPPATYTVKYRALDPVPSMFTQVSPPFSSLFLLDLEPMTQYEFYVRVHRQGKDSPWSKPVVNTTFAADFSQPPLIAEVHGRANSPDVAVLTWQPNLDSKIKEYVVMYTTDRWKLQKQWQQKAAVSQNVKQQTFHGLRPETTYYFFVQAMTDLGFGPRSKVMSYTTPKEKKASLGLKVPEHLQVNVMSATSAVVSWHDAGLTRSRDKGAFDRPGVPRTYTLRYREVVSSSSGGSVNSFKMAWPTFPSIFLVDLVPGSMYEFQVRVNKGFQHSEWSDTVRNVTLEAAPGSPPQNVKVNMAGDDPTSALITWRPPELTHGNITGYQLFYGTKKGKLSAQLNVSSEQLSARVQFLQAQKSYHFSLEAWNSRGPGPPSQPVKYRTPRVIGNPPTGVTVRPAENPYNAIISWQPPSPRARRIKYYTVTHHTEQNQQLRIERVEGSELSTIIKSLHPSTTYHMRVQAHYRRGAGPHSIIIGYSIPKELLES